MAGPYTCNDMLLKIDGATLDVVTGLDIELRYEGGLRHTYGSDTGKIVIGGKSATFRIQRWYKTASDDDLFFDLFNLKLPFSLSGEIDGVSNSSITLSNCQALSWKPITGDANTEVGEEITGFATSWTSTI